eukprot:TRINITY_DN35479_c0_g1_i1.p1 TRINITY_DN35479_c0_g1~~TRINITY_DN35479_c0_g1_i1.p1  ORF type:complete len:568 (-),score=67.97 TRINITY_DN35479_c0_g1_i1:1395-3098(-)
MKARPRVRKVAAAKKEGGGNSGWARLLVVFAAAGFLLWALGSRSPTIGLGSSSSKLVSSNMTGTTSEKSAFKPDDATESAETESLDSVQSSLREKEVAAVKQEEVEQKPEPVVTNDEPSEYGFFKPDADGHFQVHPTMLKTYTLRRKLSKDNMKTVYLDHNRFGRTGGASSDDDEGEGCKGSVCPTFHHCYKGFPGIGVCTKPMIEDSMVVKTRYPANCPSRNPICVQALDNQPHAKWTAQVFVLQNVYVNVAGQIFNETHYFDQNACTSDQRFVHLAGRTSVTVYSEMVTMVDWFGWNARSNMLDLLPMLVSLDGVMPAFKGVPMAYGRRIAHRRTQLEQMQAIGMEDILGVELDNWNPQILQGPNLFFAKTLVVPLHQRCGRPSRSMWRHIRHNYLLPKDGFPMYHSDWMPRSVIPSSRPLTAANDWVVVIGLKKEKHSLADTIKLEDLLKTIFPPAKVESYYEGSMPMPKRKALLNRARLFIGIHDNVMADMVFMPPGGAIVELRPREEADPTFHHLAEVCELEYYLMFADGKRGDNKRASALRIKRMDKLKKILQGLALKFAA